MSVARPQLPVLGLAAWSGAGKTTLLTRLIPALKGRGARIAVIKHAHHQFDVDYPGKDSYRIRHSGADQTLVASTNRMALMVERHVEAEPDLGELLAWIKPERVDLVLVEGFRHLDFPKIEIHRPELGKPLLFPNDENVIAIAAASPVASRLPHLDLNDPGQIATFILESFLGAAERPAPK